MYDDVKLTVGCMCHVVIVMLAIATSLIVGHFFGFAIGLASLLVLLAAYHLWLACTYYKANKDSQ